MAGMPDARRGERPVAWFAGDADPAALEAACRRQLASFKVPTAFVRVEALPRNAMGKVDKGRLREALAEGDEGPSAGGWRGGTRRGVGTRDAYGFAWPFLAWGTPSPVPPGLLE